jgi:predicted nuclease of predicted toxin-antitoxin system
VSLALCVDVHVPAPITRQLKRRGVDVLTAQEDGRPRAPDDELLDRATELQRVLFSRDEDFLSETKKRQEAGIFFSGVIYAHQLRVTIGRCINDLELMAKVYEQQDMNNRVEHLPLR